MIQKKHIVIVTTNFANGGTERRAMVLANGFSEKGYKVTYLVMNKIYPDVVYKLDDSIELVSISDFASSDAAAREKELSQQQIRTKQKMLTRKHRILKLLNIDDIRVKRWRSRSGQIVPLRAFMMCNRDALFIAFGIEIYERLFYAADGLGCSLIFSDASAPQFKNSPKEKLVFDKVLSKQINKAAACIFQTQDQMAYYGKCVKSNGYIIKNPLTAKLPPVYEGERKHIIVNFCRTHPVKNLILLVDAFKLFSEEFPDYTLEIYGATSTEIAENYKTKVCKRIHEVGLEKKAKVYDAVPDVHKRIFDYGMYVSSSDSEGLSNSMIEAMALGLPCICTDCEGGGAREMINDGENGLLVPVRDADAMYRAMRSLALQKDLSNKCGKNAANVRNELSADNILNEWINVFNKVKG